MSAEAVCVLEAAVADVCKRRVGAPGWRELGVERARLVVEAAERPRPLARVAVDVEDIAIAVGGSRLALGDGSRRLRVRIYRPAGEPGSLPAVLYLHGAGWTFDGSRSHDQFARVLAASSSSVVLLPAYARAPEARHPVALEQCYELLAVVASGELRRGIHPSKLALAGDGTGGGLAAGLSLLVHQRGGPAISAQILICPALDPCCDTPSHRKFAGGAALDRDDVRWLWEQYVGDRREPVDVTAAPLRADTDQLRGLAPALVVTAEVDVLRDEGERYADKLREAGVEVLATRYLATVHGFCHLAALQETAATRAVIEQAGSFLRRATETGRHEQR